MTPKIPEGCGAIYFAVGAAFAREAERSAASVRLYMPELPIAIFVDCPVEQALFDQVLPMPADLPMKRQKMNALRSTPFQRTLYLDTDTLLLAPVWELFDILESFDAAMALAPGYTVSNEPDGRLNDGVPAAYPRWNAGLIAFNRSPEWIALVEMWDRLYQSMGREFDQSSFRVATFRSAARIAPLPCSYNYRLNYPSAVRGIVKILHGRSPDLETMHRKINRRMKMRATMPKKYKRGLIVHGDNRIVRNLKNLGKLWPRFRSRLFSAASKPPAMKG